MNLGKYLTKSTIAMTLKGQTPEEVLREMVELLCRAGKMDATHIDDAVKALIRREKMMSTGLHDGVAIPHAKTNGVNGLVGAIAIKREGIDFDSLDGKPARIFVMTLSPKDISVPHVQFLAEVAKILQTEDVRETILEAKSKDELIDILFGHK
jgi:mannitol/fructose-specific phosphotransferase system IIA component (Ntr-type)